MNILTISDVPSKPLWDYFDKERLQNVDLILSCGDLPAEYLSFLVTFSNCPLLYVHGNHDVKYAVKPPEGCECIENRIYEFGGLRILGLGGSYAYSGGMHQYTDKEMEKRLRKLKGKIRRKKGFDILLTHAPALGINDQDDLPHRGFMTFLNILDQYSPRYMIHGHVHMNYGYQIPRLTQYHDTMVVNAYEKYLLQVPESI